jgi:hypothetical protein
MGAGIILPLSPYQLPRRPQPSNGQGSTSAFRRPGLVIAGRRRPRIGGQGRTRRAPGLRRAGQIWLMRQFPSARGVLFLGWRNIERVMKPAIPALRGHGPVALPGINDPAALETERLVDFPGPVIAVAVFILADEFAKEQCVQRRI